MKKWTLFLVVFLALPAVAQEAKPFKVAEGSVSGTYGAMFKELQEACSTETLPLVKIPDMTDAVSNLNALVTNQANAAFLRSDVIFFRGMNEDLNHIKTLFSLWQEEVHVVTLAQSKTTVTVVEKGKIWDSKRNQTIEFNTFADLKGFKVGAAGGNRITAEVLNLQSSINYEVVPFADGKQALAALDAGDVQAVIFTAGQPLPILQKLGPGYKLLPFPDAIAEKVKGVYKPAKLYYPQMTTAAVPTVASDALFVTRVYRTPEKIKQLAQLRACFYAKLDQLKDEGVNPKWQSVNPDNKGPWGWYELPVEVATPAVSRKRR